MLKNSEEEPCVYMYRFVSGYNMLQYVYTIIRLKILKVYIEKIKVR